MNPNKNIKIGNFSISPNSNVYFVADIASSHDGELSRAKELIYLAKNAGAHAAKFQHFLAPNIVSDQGFQQLGSQQSHQSTWKKSVYETYKQYETKREWNEELIKTCKEAEIDFMTTPYDMDAINTFMDSVPAFKVGSGDITWIESIRKMSESGKPIMLATGASCFEDVVRAVDAILEINTNIILMQCNTNYTVKRDNFKYINLEVINTYKKQWPNIITGLSDHTPGHTTVLGAVALGARVIEKHFTDDNLREGPDHSFSMNPQTWREMVDATEDLIAALGDGVKKVEGNELETVILQRRCIRLKRSLDKGSIINYGDVEFLRPAPSDSLPPYKVNQVVGKTLIESLEKGSLIKAEHIN